MEHSDTTVEYDTTVVHCNTTVKQLDTIVNTVTLESDSYTHLTLPTKLEV